jgi:2-polyprenyl-3-methyl-5-hydroxy-6-metoxy-1,4-benzoquinol methylase
MKTDSLEYKEHLENKYLPGRSTYLKHFFYPKIFKTFHNQGKIYDLGCGMGEFLSFCKSKNREAIGIDSNVHLVDICKNKGLNAVVDNVISPASINEQIQNVLIDNVLEHLDNDALNIFFENSTKYIQKGGFLIVIIPDKKGFKKDPTHITFVNYNILKEKCDMFNLKIKSQFSHPFNVKSVGNFLYLNMQVFVIQY